jgi:uncharacterized protein YggE
MKKLLVAAGFAATLLLAAALAGVGLPEQAHGEAGLTRTVTVSGEGVVEARPDEASFSFGVQSQGATAEEASAANAAAMRRLIAALKEAGVSLRDIQTEHVSVWPSADEKGGVTGYTASNSVTVQVGVDRAGGLVSVATGAGANTLWGPNLTREDTDAQEEQALERALADARRKAEALAKAAGAQLGEVVKMVEGGAQPIPVYGEAMRAADAQATPIEAGTLETRAALTVTFALG